MGSTHAGEDQRARGAGRRGEVVVVGHDGSRDGNAALAHGGRRVGPDGHLIVIRALRPHPAEGPSPAGAPGAYADIVTSLLEAVRTELPAGITYEIRVTAGSLTKALVETAERHRASAMVLAAHPPSMTTGANGAADAVLTGTMIPVAIVAARPRKGRSPQDRRELRVRGELQGPRSEDPVEQRGLESFPASDPPPWWAGAPRAASPQAPRKRSRVLDAK